MGVRLLILLSLIFSGIITLSLAVYASKKLNSTGSTTYMLLMISISIYTLGYAFELYNTTASGIFLALKIEYLGIVTLPVFWFILALKYTGYGKKATFLIYSFLFIIPLTTIIVLYTNNFHHIYYVEFIINREDPFFLATTTKGFWYYIHITYANILLIGGIILFISMIISSTGTFRKQALVMLIISLISWGGNILYLAGFGPYGIDLNPFFLTITGPLFALALFKFDMFNITPIARDTVFEEMSNPIIVLDNGYRVVDFNKGVLKIFPQFSNNVFGLEINELIPENIKLLKQIYSKKFDILEIVIENEGSSFYYNSMITELYSSSKKEIGKIINLHDISIQKKMQIDLHNLAITDELTKLYNRRYFIKTSKNELKRSRRYKRPVSFLLIDLDYFKKVNDTYGHQAGDEVLIQAAGIFIETLRDNDLIARYGGEEFTALLPEIDESGALKTAERLRANLEALTINFNNHKIKITASIGISTCLRKRYDSIDKNDILLEKLLSEADHASYAAKTNGRNRAVAYDYSS